MIANSSYLMTLANPDFLCNGFYLKAFWSTSVERRWRRQRQCTQCCRSSCWVNSYRLRWHVLLVVRRSAFFSVGRTTLARQPRRRTKISWSGQANLRSSRRRGRAVAWSPSKAWASKACLTWGCWAPTLPEPVQLVQCSVDEAYVNSTHNSQFTQM